MELPANVPVTFQKLFNKELKILISLVHPPLSTVGKKVSNFYNALGA